VRTVRDRCCARNRSRRCCVISSPQSEKASENNLPRR
jgi:hypothetical protein